jgi:hypothetical protein
VVGETTGGQLTRSEAEREDNVRQVACPLCHMPAGQRCENGRTRDGRARVEPASHTARYLAAVDAGLVPQMAGWPWTT